MAAWNDARVYDVADPKAPRRLITDLIVPKISGGACEVPKGHIVRIVCIDGGQVCDFKHLRTAKASKRHGSHGNLSCYVMRIP